MNVLILIAVLYKNLYDEQIIQSVKWLGSSLRDLQSFPGMVQDDLGHKLHRVQLGLMPSDFKSMRSVGTGVYEIRSHVGGEHRLFYIAVYDEAVYVLHAFQKKTQKTSRRDIEISQRRLAALQWQKSPRHL